MMTMTAQECRAARILAQVDRDALCEESGVTKRVLADFENQNSAPGPDDLKALKDALERLGITFIPEARGAGAGIRLKFSRKQSAGISSWETEGGEAAEDSLP
ncbi:MAG: helix-turn-helix transcriptional regulator [Rhizobium sp.]|nr:helix-turn-helix transcriptional regulator [Rhizobium sp.]